jgi:hypothetical protein
MIMGADRSRISSAVQQERQVTCYIPIQICNFKTPRQEWYVCPVSTILFATKKHIAQVSKWRNTQAALAGVDRR